MVRISLMKNEKIKAFLTGLYDPFALIYTSFRVLARLLLGKQRRNTLLKTLHWESLYKFLENIGLPDHLQESAMAKEIMVRIKRKCHTREQNVVSLLGSKRGQIFIDIGANLGYYSFFLHDNFEKILAVEPHPKNIRIMIKNKRRYGYDKVSILPFAISDVNGEEMLFLSPNYGGHTLIEGFIRQQIQRQNLNFIAVPSITLESLLKKTVKIDTSVDLVKVDVEGAEWKVLEGTKKIMNRINSWLIELHDMTRKEKLEKLLKSYNYALIWVDREHVYAWRKVT